MKTLKKILDQSIDQKLVLGTSFCIKYRDFQWYGVSGNIRVDDLYFIASTTKLFVTAIIMKLRSKGILLLEERISKYLSEEIMKDLHVLNGNDHSKEITVKHLLSHTSGIPDYFMLKRSDGKSLLEYLTEGNDIRWSFEEAVEMSRALKPQFNPGKKGKAHYSDTNFQLLGKIIENIYQKSFDEVCTEEVFKPLEMDSTYIYRNIGGQLPKNIFFKNSELKIPLAMASFGPDGGAVSNSVDMMKFIEAFFKGVLFPLHYFDEMKKWNPIFFPMRSGVGIHLFKLPWILDPFGKIPDLIGHSGLSGALAYSNPGQDLFITGTVNQIHSPGTSFRLMLKLINRVLKR